MAVICYLLSKADNWTEGHYLGPPRPCRIRADTAQKVTPDLEALSV